MAKAQGVTPKTRRVVIERDSTDFHGPTCQWCGRVVDVQSGFYSLQHRRARGMGGSRLPDTNQPQNLVLVCGSATTGCHGFIESHPHVAAERGFRLAQSMNPAHCALVDYRGNAWWLTPDGRRVPVGPEPVF